MLKAPSVAREENTMCKESTLYEDGGGRCQYDRPALPKLTAPEQEQ